MRRIIIHDAEATKELVKAEIHRTDETRFQHRLHCIILMCNGKTCAEVAALFGDSLRAVQYWAKSFNAQGLSGLRDAAKPGRKARLSAKDKEVLSKNLRQPPTAFGYSQNLWDGKLLCHHIKEKFMVELKVRQCQNLFHELGFRRRKPRPLIAKADPEKQKAFKKNC
jgi:transposase